MATAQLETSVDVPSNQPRVFQSVFAGPLKDKPVTATMMPMMVMAAKATNLKNMNKSPVRAANRVEMQLKKVTTTRARKAGALLIQGLISSTSAPIAARMTYSPK